MNLHVKPPFPPMEALAVDEIPAGEGWLYEPKWDGFRCLIFKDGDRIELQSKSGQPLARYFPEIVEAVQTLKESKLILDGELVIPQGDAFSFDALLLRLHPAASRVKKLAAETPAIFIAFDLLQLGEKALHAEPLRIRREALNKFASSGFLNRKTFRLSPATERMEDAKKWLQGVGAMLDGVIAKRVDLPYQTGLRTGMQKVKNYRSADCVVGGFRYGTAGKLVGSLLLGLYDEAGCLNHVGFTSSIRQKEKPALTRKLEGLVEPPGFTGNAPGGRSRWAAERSGEWSPLRPELVVEVCYDHFSGGRFRHGTKLLRWRPDKAPGQCGMDQLSQAGGNLLGLLK